MAAWGLAGSVLALETIKRGIVGDNLSRDLLIGPLLAGGLLDMLLEKLDWQRRGGEEEVTSLLDLPAMMKIQYVLCTGR